MATKAQCAFCFDVLAAKFEGRDVIPLSKFEQVDAALDSPSVGSDASSKSISSSSYSSVARPGDPTGQSYPLFITWNIVSHGDTRLRGCIGTFEAQPLEKGLRSYAAISAFEDTRFKPISAKELPLLECGVSLLCDFEDASGPLDWEWGVHGIRIAFVANGRRYSGTYLPDVPPEHFKSKEHTLESLVYKAGYNGSEWKKLSIHLVRFKSSKEHMLYREYVALKKKIII